MSEKRWRARSRGEGVEGRGGEELDEDGFQSGDCDDEDECAGVSGLGPPPRRKRLRIFAGEAHRRTPTAVKTHVHAHKCEHTHA